MLQHLDMQTGAGLSLPFPFWSPTVWKKVAFKRCGCRQFINAIAVTLQRATNLGLLPKKTNLGRLNKVGPNAHKVFIVF